VLVMKLLQQLSARVLQSSSTLAMSSRTQWICELIELVRPHVPRIDIR
jgi:hypothetical protein